MHVIITSSQWLCRGIDTPCRNVTVLGGGSGASYQLMPCKRSLLIRPISRLQGSTLGLGLRVPSIYLQTGGESLRVISTYSREPDQ